MALRISLLCLLITLSGVAWGQLVLTPWLRIDASRSSVDLTRGASLIPNRSFGLSLGLPIKARWELYAGVASLRIAQNEPRIVQPFTANGFTLENVGRSRTIHQLGLPLASRYYFLRNRWQCYGHLGFTPTYLLQEAFRLDGRIEGEMIYPSRSSFGSEMLVAIGLVHRMYDRLAWYVQPSLRHTFNSRVTLNNNYLSIGLEAGLHVSLTRRSAAAHN